MHIMNLLSTICVLQDWCLRMLLSNVRLFLLHFPLPSSCSHHSSLTGTPVLNLEAAPETKNGQIFSHFPVAPLWGPHRR